MSCQGDGSSDNWCVRCQGDGSFDNQKKSREMFLQVSGEVPEDGSSDDPKRSGELSGKGVKGTVPLTTLTRRIIEKEKEF